MTLKIPILEDNLKNFQIGGQPQRFPTLKENLKKIPFIFQVNSILCFKPNKAS